MKLDTYTKFVLTALTVGVFALVFKSAGVDVSPVATAEAQEGFSELDKIMLKRFHAEQAKAEQRLKDLQNPEKRTKMIKQAFEERAKKGAWKCRKHNPKSWEDILNKANARTVVLLKEGRRHVTCYR